MPKLNDEQRARAIALIEGLRLERRREHHVPKLRAALAAGEMTNGKDGR